MSTTKYEDLQSSFEIGDIVLETNFSFSLHSPNKKLLVNSLEFYSI